MFCEYKKVIALVLSCAERNSLEIKPIDNPRKRKLLGTAYISICLILFFMFLIARIIGHLFV